jgi:hypothetical protein
MIDTDNLLPAHQATVIGLARGRDCLRLNICRPLKPTFPRLSVASKIISRSRYSFKLRGSSQRRHALGADQPLAPIEDRGPRAVASSHLGGIGLGLVVAFPAPPRSA